MFLLCFVLWLVNSNVSMKLNVIFCIYEHFKSIFTIFRKCRKTWNSVCTYIYIYIYINMYMHIYKHRTTYTGSISCSSSGAPTSLVGGAPGRLGWGAADRAGPAGLGRRRPGRSGVCCSMILYTYTYIYIVVKKLTYFFRKYIFSSKVDYLLRKYHFSFENILFQAA